MYIVILLSLSDVAGTTTSGMTERGINKRCMMFNATANNIKVKSWRRRYVCFSQNDKNKEFCLYEIQINLYIKYCMNEYQI